MFMVFLVFYLLASIVAGITGASHHLIWCPIGITVPNLLVLISRKEPFAGAIILSIISLALTWVTYAVSAWAP